MYALFETKSQWYIYGISLPLSNSVCTYNAIKIATYCITLHVIQIKKSYSITFTWIAGHNWERRRRHLFMFLSRIKESHHFDGTGAVTRCGPGSDNSGSKGEVQHTVDRLLKNATKCNNFIIFSIIENLRNNQY
jgi:hypothetical protein